MARSPPNEPQAFPPIARRIRAVKWRLWHGRVNCAIRDLQELLDDLTADHEIAELPTSRLRTLGAQLLTYIASNRSAIINYGKRYRAGLRVASTLAESAVNSLVGKRMAKSQQMRWSPSGAHMLMQVRTADINGELRTDCEPSFEGLFPQSLRCSAPSRPSFAPLDPAEATGLPLIGQPLGMIQRRVRCVVTTRTSSAASGVNR